MPTGRYTVLGDDGAPAEHRGASAAPPVRWAGATSAMSRPTTARSSTSPSTATGASPASDIGTGEHDILLERRGDSLAGYRDRQEIEIPYGPQMHLDYFTPATNAITCRRLERTAEISAVYLEPITLEPVDRSPALQPRRRRPRHDARRHVRRDKMDLHEPRVGLVRPPVDRRDTVVRYDRLFTLEEYEPGASGVPANA